MLVSSKPLSPEKSDAPDAKLPLMEFVTRVSALTPVAVDTPLMALASFATVPLAVCELLALVAPVAPAPPAASTPSAAAERLLFPAWPTALASPVVDEAVPVLVMVLVLLLVSCRPLVLPLPMAAPVAPSPLKALLMVVTADTPVAVAEPLKAPAVSPTLWLAEVDPLAEVSPLPAPPAASTGAADALAVLPPFCPVALAAPLPAVADPWLETWLVLARVSLMPLSPPAMAPPVARLPR